MTEIKSSIENEFGKFFYAPAYIKLKNYMFNYQFRKSMIKSAFSEFFIYQAGKKDFLIADIGSGISPVTPVINKTVFVELEKSAVEFLKKQGLNATKGDITKLPFNKEHFDLIVCSEVLEHVKNYKKGLREINRVLKKGGGAIITVPIHQYYWNDDDDFVGHYRRFDPSILEEDIKDAGLTVALRKPIGSRLERFLTWLVVRMARKNPDNMPGNFKLDIFCMINSFLFQLIKIANKFTKEKNSSIIMFVAMKIHSS